MAASTSKNLYQVESPEQFQELLSQDLDRVSVLYFYADWAEPCASMTQVVSALSEQNKSVLFLNIEAEVLPEISESFEVDEVPYTILLMVSEAFPSSFPPITRRRQAQMSMYLRLSWRHSGPHTARTGVWCAAEASIRRDRKVHFPSSLPQIL